ncbi:hypothetical protein ACVIIW_004147 [Bradyrhizobium sp. USDA 4449]
MRNDGAPRSTFAGGASERSGKWPSRVWITSMPVSRAAFSTAPIGFTARASWLTSLPSVSPKPPGSMKSRCMSMITSAVDNQSSLIGSGSALMTPSVGLVEFNMTRPRENSLSQEFCKRRAIVYNRGSVRETREIAAHSEGYARDRRLLIPCASAFATCICSNDERP